jgi:hypothetical protein
MMSRLVMVLTVLALTGCAVTTSVGDWLGLWTAQGVVIFCWAGPSPWGRKGAAFYLTRLISGSRHPGRLSKSLVVRPDAD